MEKTNSVWKDKKCRWFVEAVISVARWSGRILGVINSRTESTRCTDRHTGISSPAELQRSVTPYKQDSIHAASACAFEIYSRSWSKHANCLYAGGFSYYLKKTIRSFWTWIASLKNKSFYANAISRG